MNARLAASPKNFDRLLGWLAGEDNLLLHNFLRFCAVALPAGLLMVLFFVIRGSGPPATSDGIEGMVELPPAAIAEPTPDQSITNSVGMELVLIPVGEFMMGSTNAKINELLRLDSNLERDWFDHEHPHHKVRITKPFYLGVTK